MSPQTVSSTPVLRTTLVWSAIVTGALLVIGAVVGFLVAGVSGLWSALAGVLRGWLLKFVVFLVLLLVLRGQPWITPLVFFVAVVVGVLAALSVDVVTLVRMRIPHVSDVALPTDPDEGERRAEES